MGNAGSFEHLVMLGFFDALVDEGLSNAAAFVVLVFVEGFGNLMAGGSGDGIPAFGFGGGFQFSVLGIEVGLAGEFAGGLFDIEGGNVPGVATIDEG